MTAFSPAQRQAMRMLVRSVRRRQCSELEAIGRLRQVAREIGVDLSVKAARAWYRTRCQWTTVPWGSLLCDNPGAVFCPDCGRNVCPAHQPMHNAICGGADRYLAGLLGTDRHVAGLGRGEA